MIIRIRFGRGPRIGVRRRKKRRAALVLSVLLTPVAAMALALALWGVAADLNWTSSFAISSGLFSHWQSWLGAAALLQLAARMLNRYARNGDAPAS
jgi:uncharacterized membrane protein